MEISAQTWAVGSQAAGDMVSPPERRWKGQSAAGAGRGFHRWQRAVNNKPGRELEEGLGRGRESAR